MTIAQVMQEFHKLYAHDTDYPDSSEDEFITRVAYLNDARNVWKNKKGVQWSTLFDTYSDIFVAGTLQATLSTLGKPAGFMRVTPTNSSERLYHFVPVHKVQIMTVEQLNEKPIFWVTGKPGEYKINVYPAPSVDNGLIGAAYSFDYYNRITNVTGVETSYIEMTDPYFAIYWMLFRQYTDDGSDQDSTMFQIANEKLDAMHIENDSSPFYQDNSFEDITFSGFGN